MARVVEEGRATVMLTALVLLAAAVGLVLLIRRVLDPWPER